jgi:plasmid maintenance system antidote protein VapI
MTPPGSIKSDPSLMPLIVSLQVVACLADSIEYSADNALAIIDGQTAITKQVAFYCVIEVI